jgi:hypothetical protein
MKPFENKMTCGDGGREVFLINKPKKQVVFYDSIKRDKN